MLPENTEKINDLALQPSDPPEPLPLIEEEEVRLGLPIDLGRIRKLALNGTKAYQ